MKNRILKKILKDEKIDILIIISIISFYFMIFGICHLWDFGTFGITILGGVFVAVAVLLVQELYIKKKMKDEFSWLQGKWDGGWKLENRMVNPDNQSEAEITYLNENILSVTLTHDKEKPRTWEGIIEMNKQIINRGSLVFKYNDSHESGYKELLISSDSENDYIYLYPVIYDGRNFMNYGIQVFKRARKSLK